MSWQTGPPAGCREGALAFQRDRRSRVTAVGLVEHQVGMLSSALAEAGSSRSSTRGLLPLHRLATPGKENIKLSKAKSNIFFSQRLIKTAGHYTV